MRVTAPNLPNKHAARTCVANGLLALLAVACFIHGVSASPSQEDLSRQFTDKVQPFLSANCLACHDRRKHEGELDLSVFSSIADVAKGHRIWETLLERLEAGDMPPEKAPRQPTPEERRAVIDWIRAQRQHEARKHAGDPGPVLAHRLSNAEYDYTIRDLTGVNIRPTREFPVDPANAAGFDNSGESLAMSPALLKKYLAAARLVADHVVFEPAGFVFAPHPVVTETDRDKYCVGRIIDFYQRQRTDLADYILAAWRFQHRAALGKSHVTLADLATEDGISAKYLATIWSTLTDTKETTGPLVEVQTVWRQLPAPGKANQDVVRQACEQLRDLVVRERQELRATTPRIGLRGISVGSQWLILWQNRRQAENRMRYNGEAKTPAESAALARFCQVFPDAFYVSERGRKEGRPLSAGFHLMIGYFRDDAPLCELMLDDQQRQELDALWQDLNFVTSAPLRQYKDFLFFERSEAPMFLQDAQFDFARPEDKDVTSAAKIQKLNDLYLAKARELGGQGEIIEAIESYFVNISSQIRQVERGRVAAEPSHLTALCTFAERAFRRPLATPERDKLLAFYRARRSQDGLSHEDAIRDCIAYVLVSPNFCFRADISAPGNGAQPLSDYELASRLSYFLWSSMPDAELLAHAAAGDLHRREILVAQTRRMLTDDRMRGFAKEFGGNWLDFRRFEEHNGVDRQRFPAFSDSLRQAMFEEPLHFILDIVQENRSVLDFLDARHTFVNPLLAEHYGMPVPNVGPNDWVRVADADKYGRGGLLPMSVFLTANSPGLRTSPVKRGYWVVRRLLGEHIPPPPPQVAELPKDEASTGELSVRELLAQHREDRNCAACHQRFDSIGLVFEGYGPIGERRAKDLGGRLVDARATFPDGSHGNGLAGLREYLHKQRQQEFVDNLCRKLLAYALGRGLLLSDDVTIEETRSKLAADDYHFHSLIESLVTSPQFLSKRGRDQM